MVRDASPPGLKAADLIAHLRAGVVHDEPAYVALVRLVTLDGRIPFDVGVRRLDVRTRCVLSMVMGDESLRLTEQLVTRGDGFFVTVSAQGCLRLVEHPSDDGAIAGYLTLRRSVAERAAEAAADWGLRERAERRSFDLLVRRWHDTGELPARINQVADWVERVETVLIHVEDEVFSRSDAGTNTLLRDGVLDQLGTRDPDDWTAAERLFVAAAHVLFAAGRAIRFEEFNGQQISATSLRAWLVTTWLRYAGPLYLAAPNDLSSRCPLALAEEISELAEQVNRSDHVRFRRIEGPTFGKHERVVPLSRRQRSLQTTPLPVRQWVVGRLGLDSDVSQPGEQTVRAATAAILELPPEQTQRSLAELLEVIVQAAVAELSADYAMSSAVRDLAGLAREGESRVARMLRLGKRDFFCCVVPHPQLRQPSGPALGKMLWLVAQRMQYNRWHFAPGNFDRCEIPLQRHYFFPPALPDITEHGDLWHGGHVTAGVRFSVRAPGASLWREPLLIGGNAYRGCFDIRAVRMTGTPFTRQDLWTAVRYTGLVDAVWRTVARALDRGCPVPPVIAFDGTWYEQKQW